MPTPGYLCRHRDKPIDKAPVFLLFKLVFLLAHHNRYIDLIHLARIRIYQNLSTPDFDLVLYSHQFQPEVSDIKDDNLLHFYPSQWPWI